MDCGLTLHARHRRHPTQTLHKEWRWCETSSVEPGYCLLERHQPDPDLHEVRLQKHVCVKASAHSDGLIEHAARWSPAGHPACKPYRLSDKANKISRAV